MVELRTATPDDIPAISAMRETVGWAAPRWALLDAMRPPHAHFVLAVDRAAPVAMGSGIAYGRLGVIGNMVVDEGHRRQGIGSAILERVLAFLTDERGCTLLELSATTSGRPLYERYGFEAAGGSAMVSIPRAAVVGRPGGVERATPDAGEALAVYDAARFGGDRGPLLSAALVDGERPTLVVRSENAIAGYAVIRVEVGRLGPWLADDLEVAATLLTAAAELAPGTERLSTSIGLDNERGVAWLREISLSLEPWEGRMRRGDAASVQRRPETVYGNAVGALG